MELARSTCDRARHSRDPRFDGRFFIAVTSTRIYCRPICPARSAKDEHVIYFPSSAAAEAAGFRPCLRCRPEASPGTPAWVGTSAIVSRALRLIGEGALDHDSVDALAERLGVTARHMRRLFVQHLGATPREVALTRRLHFAKKLLDETQLACERIAYAAGFGSVRRFNSEIRRMYARTPTQLRRLARRSDATAVDHYQFRLAYRPPYDWHTIVQFFAARAIAGVEHVTADRYARTIVVDGHQGTIDVTQLPARHALVVEVRFPEPASLLGIVERVRHMFDLGADPATLREQLGGDPVLAPLLDAHPGIRMPGAWDGFELAVTTLVEPDAPGATARIAARFGTPLAAAREGPCILFPAPHQLARATLEDAGVPPQLAATIRSLAAHVARGSRDALPRFAGFDDWTTAYLAMRVLGEPDAFPDDGALHHATGDPDASALARRAERWRPWRAYAALLLSHAIRPR